MFMLHMHNAFGPTFTMPVGQIAIMNNFFYVRGYFSNNLNLLRTFYVLTGDMGASIPVSTREFGCMYHA